THPAEYRSAAQECPAVLSLQPVAPGGAQDPEETPRCPAPANPAWVMSFHSAASGNACREPWSRQCEPATSLGSGPHVCGPETSKRAESIPGRHLPRRDGFSEWTSKCGRPSACAAMPGSQLPGHALQHRWSLTRSGPRLQELPVRPFRHPKEKDSLRTRSVLVFCQPGPDLMGASGL